MHDVKHCLPHVEAKKHFQRLKARALESSIEAHQKDLTLLRAKFAERGTLGSGHQIAQECKLTEHKIDSLANAYLNDALKTIELYRIPLTQQLCDCLEQAMQRMLTASYGHAVAALGQGMSQLSPERLHVSLANGMQQRRFKAMMDISIRLTESRLAYERQEEQRVSESDAKGHTYNVQYNTVNQGGTINAPQTGDVHVQTLTGNDFETIAACLAEVRAELRAGAIVGD